MCVRVSAVLSPWLGDKPVGNFIKKRAETWAGVNPDTGGVTYWAVGRVGGLDGGDINGMNKQTVKWSSEQDAVFDFFFVAFG